MMTQWRLRIRAVTIHPVRRSKQQHLRINNIFRILRNSLYSTSVICVLYCIPPQDMTKKLRKPNLSFIIANICIDFEH